jgi:hypothetical protein
MGDVNFKRCVCEQRANELDILHPHVPSIGQFMSHGLV